MHRIVIIEDNPQLNDAFATIVNFSENFRVAGKYLNCEDAIKNIYKDKPDVVLMDLELPGMNGVEGTKQIRKLMPKTLILIVSVYENSEMVFNALCAGASGYLTKNTTSKILIESIQELLDGGAPMSISIARMVVSSFQKAANSILSDRETEVITLLAQGKSYKSIGETLNISRNTIKFHIKNIYEKLEVNNREDAISLASEKKYI
ncbi:MAG TPA: response regulator transcription factor [Saprospiraceae bacterium]|nr:response regulator transcription factor [Saprospiraceae bacterium]HPN71254.1 response regulator transcription factor [Saprospiraceae bacterium]